MPVEIHFLSGSRQGERIHLDASEFSAGDHRDCQVFFDATQDPGAQGRAAFFRFQEDGWHVRNAGDGELLINDQRLTGPRRIRSGDVVRMSDRGPDFTFSLIDRAAAAAQAAAAVSELSELRDLTNPPALPALSVVEDPSRPAPRGAWNWPTALPYIGGGAVVAMLICGLAWLISASLNSDKRQPPEPPVEVGQSAIQTESPPNAAVATNPAAALEARSNARSQPPVKPAEPVNSPEPQAVKTVSPDREPAPAAPVAESATPALSWQEIGSRASKAILVLCVEDTQSKSVWPFATATAVSDKLILTTATVATELTRFRQDSNRWNVWACQDPSGERYPLKDLRVHRGYVESGESAEKKVYFDVALISVEQTLPAILPLASPETLAELGGGYPLVCVGISHEGEPVNRFERLQPQSVPAKIFALTALEPSPNAPRLLHINESIPLNFYGAPLITPEGSVAAVYSTPAASEDKAAENLHMHYAVVVEPQLIDLWKQGRGEDVWMAPSPAPAPSPARPSTP